MKINKFKKILSATSGLVIGAACVPMFLFVAIPAAKPIPLESMELYNIDDSKVLKFEKYNQLNFSVTYDINNLSISRKNLELSLNVVSSEYDHQELLNCLKVEVESRHDTSASAYVQIVDTQLTPPANIVEYSVIEIVAYDRFFPEQRVTQNFQLDELVPYLEIPQTEDWFKIDHIGKKNILSGWATGVTIEDVNEAGYNTLHVPTYVDEIASKAFFIPQTKYDTTVTRLIIDGNACELKNFCFGSFEFTVLDLSSAVKIGNGIMVSLAFPSDVIPSSENSNALQINANSTNLETAQDNTKVLHLGKKLNDISYRLSFDVQLLLAIEPVIEYTGELPSFIVETYSVDSFSIDKANKKYKVFNTYGIFGEIIGKTLLEVSGNNIKSNLEYKGHKIIVPAGGTLMMGCVNIADWFKKLPSKSIYVPTFLNYSIKALNFGKNIGEILPSEADIDLDFDSTTGAIKVHSSEQWQLRGFMGSILANKFSVVANLSHQEFLYACMNNGLLSSLWMPDAEVKKNVYPHVKYEQPLVPVLNASANEYVDAVLGETRSYIDDNHLLDLDIFPAFCNGNGKYYARTSIGISQATIKSLEITNIIDLDYSIRP
ncbi:MAG: hypothetical protein LBV53_01205 [Mycoplasmataceae bacterium]|nr:hypothetical protein [Mycoplasmataceae bacterium]